MAIYELDPVDQIAISAVGEPGRRRFFLLASGSGRTMTLGCEKSQVQALVLRLRQMLEGQQVESPGKSAEASANGPAPGEPEWQIGEMGLGYHEARRMFVLVASEAAPGEAAAGEGGEAAETTPPPGDAPSVRFWLSPDQVAAFSRQAESVLAAGRPLCPRCGLPIDPSGHPCPVMNGARPIF